MPYSIDLLAESTARKTVLAVIVEDGDEDREKVSSAFRMAIPIPRSAQGN